MSDPRFTGFGFRMRAELELLEAIPKDELFEEIPRDELLEEIPRVGLEDPRFGLRPKK